MQHHVSPGKVGLSSTIVCLYKLSLSLSDKIRFYILTVSSTHPDSSGLSHVSFVS